MQIDEIGEANETHSNALNCISDLTDCCSSLTGLRGEFEFPDGSLVPSMEFIRNGYYRTRSASSVKLNRRPEGMAQGLFRCRIRTVASPMEYEDLYIGVYGQHSGLYTVPIQMIVQFLLLILLF